MKIKTYNGVPVIEAEWGQDIYEFIDEVIELRKTFSHDLTIVFNDRWMTVKKKTTKENLSAMWSLGGFSVPARWVKGEVIVTEPLDRSD